MNKVLLIGSDFRWYNESYKKNFEKLNCNVKIFETKLGVDRKAYSARLKRALGLDISDYYAKKIEIQSEAIREEFLAYKPDLVFVRTGNQVNYETVKYMSETATTVLFLSDSLERYTQLRDVVSAYSKVYSFEKSDIIELEALDIKGDTLMGTFDDYQYFPLDREKNIDVSFVGAMYPFRKEILEKLRHDFPGLKMEFHGKYIPSHNLYRLFKYLNSDEKNTFTNKNVHYVDVNEIYNRSKICLNLQHPQSKSGWNSRLCEILGTQSFQIVNENSEVLTEFKGGLETYTTYEELKKKIRFYIENSEEREKIAMRGYQIAIEKYTTLKSVEKILNDTIDFGSKTE